MQNFISYAEKKGIELLKEGCCQFCGSDVEGGVIACHGNAHCLTEILNFNDPEHYESRFLSVDAMALQHCELHGPWNNYIHLTRLFLIFEKKVIWDYSKTPQLSNVINEYKKNKIGTMTPPPCKQRGKTTSSDLLPIVSVDEAIAKVRQWAQDVYDAYEVHHHLASTIASIFMDRYRSA